MPDQSTLPEVIEQEKQIIKKLVQDFDINEIKLNDTGWDSRVYSVNNGQYFFKFPRSDKIRKRYKQQIAALELAINLDTEVIIPKVRWQHPHNDYFGYEGVPGRQLDSIFNAAGSEEKQTIGTVLGGFLKQFHQLKLPAARDMSIEEEISQLHRWYLKAVPAIETAFSQSEQQRLQELVYKAIPSEMKKLGSDMKLCHGDFGGWNIIYDNGRIGVIDFGDVCYCDPSKDLLGSGDDTITESVLETYGDSEILRQKIAVRSLIPEIISLGFYLGKDDQPGLQKAITKIKQLI